MNQLPLLDNVPDQLVWNKGEVVFSLSFDQDKILRDVIRLYNKGQAFDLDPTYSKGVMWRNLPKPTLKFDIAPQLTNVRQASCDNLPLDSASIGSIMFDPPFMPTKSVTNLGKIKTRFTSFASLEEMWALYRSALVEFWRILTPEGIVVFKCQDAVSSGKNHFSHYEIEKYAREIGYEQLDLFVLGSKRVMISSTWKRQQHARKSHSYFLVFKKPEVKRRKR